jgi:hypothetical protein
MPVCVLAQEFQISLPVGAVKEDILSPIATLSDVMRNTGEDHPRYPRHERTTA